LSTSFLLLVGGALVSDGFLGLIHITPDSDIVAVTADLALFAALLVFGALLTAQFFGDLSVGGYVAVALAIVLIRPASLLLSLVGTRFDRRESWS
jgi:hypothetical protein